MSDNVAEPTGEVKNNIEEPILGDNGVNYDVYADDASASNNSSNEGAFFDSKEYEKRQKTELITNVKGADRIKRQEERAREKETRERIKNLNKIAAVDNSSAIANEKLNKEQKNLQNRIARDKFGAKLIGMLHSKIFWIIVCAIVLAIVGIIISAPLSKKIEEIKISQQTASSAKKASDVYVRVQELMSEDVNNYEKCLSIYKEEIQAADNDSDMMLLNIYYAQFIYENVGDHEKSLEILDSLGEIDLGGISNDIKAKYYNAYVNIYSPGSYYDKDKLKYYLKLYNEVPGTINEGEESAHDEAEQ